MSYKKKLASSLILTLSLSSFYAMPMSAETISELQQEQSTLRSSIEQKKAELESKSTLKSETVAKMKDISDSINATEQKIASFSTQISAQEVSIEETNKKIAENEKKLSKAQADLNERLVTIYKDGNVNYLEILFQAKDFSDFLTRFEYLSIITKRDKDLVDEVTAIQVELDNQKAVLEEQLQTLNSLRNEEIGAKQFLEEQQATQKSLYSQIEQDEEAIRENLAVMMATSQEIGNQIAALQAQNAQQGGNTATVGDSASNYQTAYVGSGVWPAPASRVITSYYGGRSYPMGGYYDFHLGTDIGAAYGTPVVAYQGGTVIIASYHWSYGNYVVVDHGNGLSTLYAHMSALSVGVGTVVAAGTQVGAIGSTGSSTGAHLHFEVRINGSTVDPAPYLGI